MRASSSVSVMAYYARAELSELTGRPMLATDGGFLGAARQALDKLGVPWELTEFQRAYNEGRSTQVPVNAAVRVKSRFARKLSHHGRQLIVERPASPSPDVAGT